MADVLRGMEDPEGQSGQEVAGREEAGHRAEAETCACCRDRGASEGEVGKHTSSGPVVVLWWCCGSLALLALLLEGNSHCRKRETSSSCGMLSSL